MKPFVLTGIDPGIRDTGYVSIMFDPDHKQFAVYQRVWSDVSSMQGEKFEIEQTFLFGLQREVETNKKHPTLIAVEGYRPRGRNMRQDQQMTTMVQTIKEAVKGSTIVDNTGVRKIITDDFLDLFEFDFPKTHHDDLESAARIALKLGSKNDLINKVLAQFVIDMVEGEKWERVQWS